MSGSAALTDFPVLISRTDSDWRTTANGGGVGRDDGGDIVFTAADGVTKLSDEVERYSASTGELVVWVRVPSLSPTEDTVLYLYYGNATAADQQDRTGAWSSRYTAVHHFKEQSGTLLDSTSNGLNATPSSGATFQSAGAIGGAYAFNGISTGLASIADSSVWDGAFSQYTVELWTNVKSIVT